MRPVDQATIDQCYQRSVDNLTSPLTKLDAAVRQALEGLGFYLLITFDLTKFYLSLDMVALAFEHESGVFRQPSAFELTYLEEVLAEGTYYLPAAAPLEWIHAMRSLYEMATP